MGEILADAVALLQHLLGRLGKGRRSRIVFELSEDAVAKACPDFTYGDSNRYSKASSVSEDLCGVRNLEDILLQRQGPGGALF